MKKRRDDIHETPDVTHIHNPEVAHEESDVNIKGILQFTAGLLVFMLISLGLMRLMYNFLEQRERQQEMKTPSGPMALTERERLPPEPRLQAAPGFGDDLQLGEGKNLELQAPQQEYRILSERWRRELAEGQRDSATGAVIALPIEEAMKRLVAEGQALQSRPAAAGQPTYEQTMEMPSFASSGRTMEKRKQ